MTIAKRPAIPPAAPLVVELRTGALAIIGNITRAFVRWRVDVCAAFDEDQRDVSRLARTISI